MKKNSWAGWKDVFQFTIVQNVKSKSFVVSTVVITLVVALLCVGINFAPALIFDIASKSEVKTVDVNTIYIVDESGRDTIDYSNLIHTKGMPENLVVVETTPVEGEQKEEDKSLIVTIEKVELGYKVSTVLKNSGVSKKDANAVLDMVADYFKQAHYKDLGITEEQVAFNQLGHEGTVVRHAELPRPQRLRIGSLDLPAAEVGRCRDAGAARDDRAAAKGVATEAHRPLLRHVQRLGRDESREIPTSARRLDDDAVAIANGKRQRRAASRVHDASHALGRQVARERLGLGRVEGQIAPCGAEVARTGEETAKCLRRGRQQVGAGQDRDAARA